MARAVWGIELGNCALRALRCSLAADGCTVSADVFDVVRHTRPLGLPDSNPQELLDDTVQHFLSRNSVQGDLAAISIPSRHGLIRTIKTPRVELNELDKILQHEARQQIPFPLEEVIWDCQILERRQTDEQSNEYDVAIFAAKVDFVRQQLRPLLERKVRPEIVQLTCACIFNVLTREFVPSPQASPGTEKSRRALAALSIGFDSSDFVIANGARLWQRPISMGGSHLTRALTKDFKLNYEQAERLKRNAAQSDDPAAVLRSLRPAFDDLRGDVQRSLGFFSNLERDATVDKLLALGPSAKLPGLTRFLAAGIGLEVEPLRSFPLLTGGDVVSDPEFHKEASGMGVCYGLCLQGLGVAQVSTNLAPDDLSPRRQRGRILAQPTPPALGGVLTGGISRLTRAFSREK